MISLQSKIMTCSCGFALCFFMNLFYILILQMLLEQFGVNYIIEDNLFWTGSTMAAGIGAGLNVYSAISWEKMEVEKYFFDRYLEIMKKEKGLKVDLKKNVSQPVSESNTSEEQPDEDVYCE